MSMVFYLLHGFDRLFVFWSISLWWYDTNRLFLKNNFRNTKLHAEAIVMHWANGSIPSFLDVICMKMFLNFRHLRLEISTSDQQYLVISFSKWKVSFLFSSYHDINFFRSSGFIPPGLEYFMSGKQSRMVCWLSRVLKRCGRYPLANLGILERAICIGMKFKESMNFIFKWGTSILMNFDPFMITSGKIAFLYM